MLPPSKAAFPNKASDVKALRIPVVPIVKHTFPEAHERPMVKMLDDVECSPFLLVTVFLQRIKARAYPIFRKCTVEYCPKTPRLPLFVRCLVPLVERDRVATTKHFLDSFFVVFSSLFDSLCQRFCQVDSRSPLNYPRRSEFRCKHSGHARPPEPSAGRAGTMDGPVQRRSRWYADEKCLVWISLVDDPFALENAKSAVFAADTHFPFFSNPLINLLPAHELGRYLDELWGCCESI